jgi:hypothetical protein
MLQFLPQGDDMRKWGIWKVIKSWGRALLSGARGRPLVPSAEGDLTGKIAISKKLDPHQTLQRVP